MRRALSMGRRALNALLSPMSIAIVRVEREHYDLALYDERVRPEPPRYINIGAGNFHHPLWHNVDTPNCYYADSQANRLHIQYDLTSHRALPLEDESIKAAYTSHVIEHVRNEDVERLFREVYRCLREDGFFRITCPDIDLEYGAYCRGDRTFWKWPNAYGVFNASIEQCFLDHVATALTETHPFAGGPKCTTAEVKRVLSTLPKAEALDHFTGLLEPGVRLAYAGDHVNWFNVEKISAMLRKAGFTRVYESRYGQSLCPIMRERALFDSTCPELSLYIECQK